MNNYRLFQQSKIKKLLVKRNGWFRPTYEITDGSFSYGMLSATGFFTRTVQIDTAGASWLIHTALFSNRRITTPEGRVIGEVKRKFFSSETHFIGADGFTAIHYRPGSLFSPYVWITKDGQVLIREVPGFTRVDAFIYPDLAYEQPYLLLLAFLGLDFSLIRSRKTT